MSFSLGNLAVAGARAAAGYGRGQLAGTQLAITEGERQQKLRDEALRLSLAQRADARGERSLNDLNAERVDNRHYRDALLRHRDGITPREQESDAYASAKAIAEYQAGTNARAWKPETLGVYLQSRFPKLDPNRLLGLAQQALAKSGGLLHLNLDAAAENLPPE